MVKIKLSVGYAMWLTMRHGHRRQGGNFSFDATRFGWRNEPREARLHLLGLVVSFSLSMQPGNN